jgi:predicted alpha/beta-fold hydrolase
VCKQFGYATWEDYYRDACLDGKIQNIKTPTLFLNACDDMFSPERAFPLEKIKQNPFTAMVCTKYGGHIAFCEGLLPTGCNYACRLLGEYINYVLNEIDEEEAKLGAAASSKPTVEATLETVLEEEEQDATNTPLFTL